MTIARITVDLDERAYDIVIGEGVLGDAGALIAPLLKRPRIFVVTDENVRAAQGERLAASLAKAGVAADMVTLAPGEATKTMMVLDSLLARLIALEVGRDDLIVAFGGGVIGDLAGFAAAILKRGVRFAQIPTSLLAQVDSAVGGKTGVNVAAGKNLVGAFHQPVLVISDVGALATLPGRELVNGYAEIVKYGALGDADFFAWLEANGDALLKGDAAARIHAVKRSCEMKAAIVADDERESGARALLNLGHTFGHALEAALGYSSALLHGEAVAAGMGLAFDFSARRKFCPPADAARLKAHLRGAGLPAGVEDIADARAHDPKALVALMRQDKKVSAGALTLILAQGIGAAHIANNVASEDVFAFLAEKAGRKGPTEGRDERT